MKWDNNVTTTSNVIGQPYCATCAICNHTKMKDIEMEWVASASTQKEILKKYGVCYKSVVNHMKKHYRPSLSIVGKKDILVTFEGLKNVVKENFEILEKYKAMYDNNTPEGLMALGAIMEQERKYVETGIKLIGIINENCIMNDIKDNKFLEVEFIEVSEDESKQIL